MSAMLYKQIPGLLGIAMVLLAAGLFGLISYLVFRRGNRAEMDRASHLPLDE